MNRFSPSTMQLAAAVTEAQVVLIDDDPALVRALRFDLETEGFSVQAHLTPETLRTDELPADNACLVVDFRLPGITALELLERLRANGVRLPAIIITTHPRPSLAEQASELGAVVVEKPLLGDGLVKAIRAALRSHP